MTYDQAAALYSPNTNPRWIAAHAALGREPRSWEMTEHNTKCWEEFAALHGHHDKCLFTGIKHSAADHVFLTLGLDAGQKSFNDWLRKKYGGKQ